MQDTQTPAAEAKRSTGNINFAYPSFPVLGGETFVPYYNERPYSCLNL